MEGRQPQPARWPPKSSRDRRRGGRLPAAPAVAEMASPRRIAKLRRVGSECGGRRRLGRAKHRGCCCAALAALKSARESRVHNRIVARVCVGTSCILHSFLFWHRDGGQERGLRVIHSDVKHSRSERRRLASAGRTASALAHSASVGAATRGSSDRLHFSAPPCRAPPLAPSAPSRSSLWPQRPARCRWPEIQRRIFGGRQDCASIPCRRCLSPTRP